MSTGHSSRSSLPLRFRLWAPPSHIARAQTSFQPLPPPTSLLPLRSSHFAPPTSLLPLRFSPVLHLSWLSIRCTTINGVQNGPLLHPGWPPTAPRLLDFSRTGCKTGPQCTTVGRFCPLPYTFRRVFEYGKPVLPPPVHVWAGFFWLTCKVPCSVNQVIILPKSLWVSFLLPIFAERV